MATGMDQLRFPGLIPIFGRCRCLRRKYFQILLRYVMSRGQRQIYSRRRFQFAFLTLGLDSGRGVDLEVEETRSDVSRGKKRTKEKSRGKHLSPTLTTEASLSTSDDVARLPMKSMCKMPKSHYTPKVYIPSVEPRILHPQLIQWVGPHSFNGRIVEGGAWLGFGIKWVMSYSQFGFQVHTFLFDFFFVVSSRDLN